MGLLAAGFGWPWRRRRGGRPRAVRGRPGGAAGRGLLRTGSDGRHCPACCPSWCRRRVAAGVRAGCADLQPGRHRRPRGGGRPGRCALGPHRRAGPRRLRGRRRGLARGPADGAGPSWAGRPARPGRRRGHGRSRGGLAVRGPSDRAGPGPAHRDAASSIGMVGAGALPVVVAVDRASGPASPAMPVCCWRAVAWAGWSGRCCGRCGPDRAEPRRPSCWWSAGRGGLPARPGGGHAVARRARTALFALAGLADGPTVRGAPDDPPAARSPAAARSQVFTVGAGAKITAAAIGAAVAGALSGLAVGWQLVFAGGCHVVAAGIGAVALGRRSGA